MGKAWFGQFCRPHRATKPLVALEHAHVPAAFREQRSAREAVDPRADDDRVVVSQRSP